MRGDPYIEWIKKGLAKPGKTQTGLALHLNIAQPQISRLLKGERDLKTREIAKVAEYLEEPPPAGSYAIPIMGRVGAGAEITPDYEHIPPEGLFTVDLPFPVPDDMVGFEIVGDSMLPKFDPGDVVVVWREQRRDTENYIGKTAAVRIEEGPRYLKKIRRGPGKNLYDLESFNAGLIEGVRLAWVGEIHVVVPADQIRRIERAERAATARRRHAREKLTAGTIELPFGDEKGTPNV